MKKCKRFLSALFAILLLLTNILTVVRAVEDDSGRITSGSLTITKLENGRTDEDGQKLPLAGVKFKIYKVDDDESSIELQDKYLQEDNYTAEATTGENGQVKFDNLDLGRYLVVEAEAPANVVEKIANFLVDIPMTNAEGNGLIYDVQVTPKNDTVYGGITLTKVDGEDKPLAGVTFILQKKNGEDWEDYELEKTLITNEEGTITLEGLPAGDYRFIETSTIKGYILDNYTTYNFNVSLAEDASTVVSPEAIRVINEKPSISKEIISISRNENNTNSIKDGINSADIGDIVSYKVTADIPSTISELNTFTISDIMDDGLTCIDDSLSIVGNQKQNQGTTTILKAASNISIEKEDYISNITEHSYAVEFTEEAKEKLMNYSSIEITYDAILNNNAVAGALGNNNKATLEYSTIVNMKYDESTNTNVTEKINASEKIYTGGFNIEKHALTKDGELLGGAVFKIAVSESDARKGNFIKDANGNEIVLTTGDGESAELGKISYKGLSYGTYYLLEVQAPTYEDNGEIKYYNLLKDPIQITVGENTYEGAANIIINKKGTTLPMTGGIGALIFVVSGVTFITLGVTYYRKNRKEEI